MSTTMDVDNKKLDIIEVVEVVPGKLTKHIIKYGDGECPASGMMCSMHYTGCLEKDGSKFDSSRDRDSPFEFQVGVGQVIKGWDEGVVTMKKGEECVFVINSDYGYGDQGAGASIPGGANLIFHVELLEFFEKERDISEMDQAEKMTYADEKKRQGNEKLKEGDLEAAQTLYLKGLDAFTQPQYPGEPEEELDVPEQAMQLKKALHSNLSIAYLKTQNYMPCIIQCKQVLNMDPNNVKALFNMIQANAELGEFETALQLSEQALSLSELNDTQKNIYRNKMVELKKRKQAEDKKNIALYSKMFAA